MRIATQRKSVVVLNRGWFFLVCIQSLSLLSHIVNQDYRSAVLTVIFIGGLMVVHWFLSEGKINTAKIIALTIINYNSLVMAIFLGKHTHIIDFLLITALLPLYFLKCETGKW